MKLAVGRQEYHSGNLPRFYKAKPLISFEKHPVVRSDQNLIQPFGVNLKRLSLCNILKKSRSGGIFLCLSILKLFIP